IKGYVAHLDVVADGQLIARHARSYGRGERILDPLHYLVTLERKPAALDHAPVYRDWKLPPVFAELRQSLEQRLGPRTGPRHFIRVLQLLVRHPLARVEQALLVCRGGVPDAAAITAQVERLAPTDAGVRDIGMSLNDSGTSRAATLAAVHVPLPDLTRFNCLLCPRPQGDSADDPSNRPAAQS